MSDYVICINNDNNPASLIVGKVYRTLSGPGCGGTSPCSASLMRDRSEPDGYLYPVAMFAPIELPEVAQRALLAAGG